MTSTTLLANASLIDEGIFLPERPASPSENFFCITPPNLPEGAQAIFDRDTGACIGYSCEGSKGVWRIYNVYGEMVGMEELPLEPSSIGPEDVFLLGFTLFKIGRTAAKVVGAKSVSSAAIRFAGNLKGRLLVPGAQKLKFARTPAQHMLNPGRYVPINIQRLAYGKRTADPQGTAGLFLYKAPMVKLFKRTVNGNVQYVKETKTLEILVRESDWTIMHFLYK